jgi:hypothetical protein
MNSEKKEGGKKEKDARKLRVLSLSLSLPFHSLF